MSFLFLCNIHSTQTFFVDNFRCYELEGEREGFYLSHQVRNGKYTVILAIAIETRVTNSAAPSSSNKKLKGDKKKDQMYQIYRPNTGLQFRHESQAELDKKYKKVLNKEAEKHWTQQYDASVNTCSHAYWRGTCRMVSVGMDCEVNIDISKHILI